MRANQARSLGGEQVSRARVTHCHTICYAMTASDVIHSVARCFVKGRDAWGPLLKRRPVQELDCGMKSLGRSRTGWFTGVPYCHTVSAGL